MNKSEAMVRTESDIEEARKTIGQQRLVAQKLNEYKPNTDEGKKARSKELENVATRINQIESRIIHLTARLEVETVAFLGGTVPAAPEPGNPIPAFAKVS